MAISSAVSRAYRLDISADDVSWMKRWNFGLSCMTKHYLRTRNISF